MATSISEISQSLGLRGARLLRTQTTMSMGVGTVRAGIVGALVVAIVAYAPAQNARLRSTAPSQECPQPGAKVDLAFIIDRSGSLDVKAQGQTYNVEIEGVRRAILDPSVIPRDRSIAVAVFTFAGDPTLGVAFTEIQSEADAVAVAASVEALKCVAAETCPLKGSHPETNAGRALLAANQHLSDNQRTGARRVLLMSTDGEFFDADSAETASNRIRESTTGIASEVDVILLGLFADPDASPDSCRPTDAGVADVRAIVKRIVFPEPENDLPGASLDINPGACNCPNAVFGSDCDRQVRDFVELIRRVLRSQPATRFLTVNTNADTDAGTPVIGGVLSLRQAIENANSIGGATTITFDSSLKDETILPGIPLPALTAPDIRICGCPQMNCDYLIDTEKTCMPFLTIDGSQTDTTKGEQHSDGILICSDRDIIRGLRIINFAGAGVTIKPVCNRGFDRIELNRFENNKKAGVRVLDSTPGSDGDVAHNIGNTISMNDIIGSNPPIDLAGDGQTANDPGDSDLGPNTLLNFPDSLSVVSPTPGVAATASGVSLTGQVNGPTAAGATVEIFAITSFVAVPGGRAINGVTFLKRGTTNADGSFTVAGLGDSPTCGYTATVIDLAGNTSELMFPCAGFAVAKVTNVVFGVAFPNQKLPQEGTFSIENRGCAPLNVSFASITRDGFRRKRGNDEDRFSIPSVGVGPGGLTTTIEAGRDHQFTATFNPTIPMAVSAGSANSSRLVLPETTRSTVTLNHIGCSLSDKTISLTGRVNSQVKLIDPKNPQNLNGVVTLERFGDLFKVVFSVYDSNPQDIDSVIYQFLDSHGNTLPLDQPLRDLSKVIQEAPLIPGQSFFVVQDFSNAKAYRRRVVSVLVTVTDKKGGKDSASGSLSTLTAAVNIQSSLRGPGKVLVLPVVKLTPWPDSYGTTLRERTGPKTQPRGIRTSKTGARKEKQQ